MVQHFINTPQKYTIPLTPASYFTQKRPMLFCTSLSIKQTNSVQLLPEVTPLTTMAVRHIIRVIKFVIFSHISCVVTS